MEEKQGNEVKDERGEEREEGEREERRIERRGGRVSKEC